MIYIYIDKIGIMIINCLRYLRWLKRTLFILGTLWADGKRAGSMIEATKTWERSGRMVRNTFGKYRLNSVDHLLRIRCSNQPHFTRDECTPAAVHRWFISLFKHFVPPLSMFILFMIYNIYQLIAWMVFADGFFHMFPPSKRAQEFATTMYHL